MQDACMLLVVLLRLSDRGNGWGGVGWQLGCTQAGGAGVANLASGDGCEGGGVEEVTDGAIIIASSQGTPLGSGTLQADGVCIGRMAGLHPQPLAARCK